MHDVVFTPLKGKFNKTSSSHWILQEMKSISDQIQDKEESSCFFLKININLQAFLTRSLFNLETYLKNLFNNDSRMKNGTEIKYVALRTCKRQQLLLTKDGKLWRRNGDNISLETHWGTTATSTSSVRGIVHFAIMKLSNISEQTRSQIKQWDVKNIEAHFFASMQKCPW